MEFRDLMEATFGVGKEIIAGTPLQMHKKIVKHNNLSNIAIIEGNHLLPETINYMMGHDDVDYRLKAQLCMLKNTSEKDVNDFAQSVITHKRKLHPYLALGVMCNEKLSDANRKAMQTHSKAIFA